MLIVILLTTTYSVAAKKKEKKDCTYFNKYEKLKDWPENERPEAFIYVALEKLLVVHLAAVNKVAVL